jgi:membrane fusion protein (multidrug efflux system)
MHDVAKSVAHLKMKGKKRPVVLAILGLVGVIVLLLGIKAMQIAKMMSSPKVMPPTTVSSAPVKEEDWAPTLSAIGSVSAVQGAVLSTDLAGTVGKVNFENGGEAKKGDVLVQLVTSQEEADLELARSNLMRTRDLAVRKVVSKQELDAAESAFKQKEGLVQHKQVRAPFDGQLGIRQVNVGQMIKEGQEVVQLTALDPVYVDFTLPQQDLSKLATGFETTVRTDSLSVREFKGKVTAINSMVDAVTRNVGVQATLANPDRALRPGMFVKVEVVLPETSKTLVIPGSAVSYAPFGDSVFVIEKKKDPKTGKESQTIRQQFVRVGESRGDFVSINQGLKAGETVVATGVFKLRNGMPVVINNDLAPKPQLNPNPVDS